MIILSQRYRRTIVKNGFQQSRKWIYKMQGSEVPTTSNKSSLASSIKTYPKPIHNSVTHTFNRNDTEHNNESKQRSNTKSLESHQGISSVLEVTCRSRKAVLYPEKYISGSKGIFL